MNKNDFVRNSLFWVLITLSLIFLFSTSNGISEKTKVLEYSHFIQQIQDKNIQKIVMDGRTFNGIDNTGVKFTVYAPFIDPDIVNKMISQKVRIIAKPPVKPNIVLAFLLNWLPLAVFSGFFARQDYGL